jgi:hypothetical protein
MIRIQQVKILPKYKLWLHFDDGTEGVVDLSDLPGQGVFAQWLDETFFNKVKISDSGELIWGTDIDLCPDALYLKVTGKKASDLFPALAEEQTYA